MKQNKLKQNRLMWKMLDFTHTHTHTHTHTQQEHLIFLARKRLELVSQRWQLGGRQGLTGQREEDSRWGGGGRPCLVAEAAM
jgi:hypothetical protein